MIATFLMNFALGALLVNFGRPAGGVSTWRLDTPPCGSIELNVASRDGLAEPRPSVTAILFPWQAKSRSDMAINYLGD